MQKLITVCELINEIFEIPIFLLDTEHVILYEKKSNFNLNPFYNSKDELFEQLYYHRQNCESPAILTTNFIENFIYFSFHDKELDNKIIIIGPSMFGIFADEQILNLINDINPFANKENILSYYRALPILENVKLLTICKLLYFMIHREELDTSKIITTSYETYNMESIYNESESFLIESRQNLQLHHNIQAELLLLKSIREGRTNRLAEYQSTTNKREIGIVSKKGYLRNSKNLAISGISLASYAAIEGGLHSEIALSLADHYIQKTEEETSSKKIRKLVMSAFSEFAERVKKNNIEENSNTVSFCRNYIYDHIYEPITLYDIANLVYLHPNYLSALIKKETGSSFSELLQIAKIEEAKQLLTLTNHSISEITAMLNYTDQSYFTKVFKKHTDKTPHQFRKNK